MIINPPPTPHPPHTHKVGWWVGVGGCVAVSSIIVTINMISFDVTKMTYAL